MTPMARATNIEEKGLGSFRFGRRNDYAPDARNLELALYLLDDDPPNRGTHK